MDFPCCLLTPLVSIVMYDAEQQDNLTWASIATLCELGEAGDVDTEQIGLVVYLSQSMSLNAQI